MTRTALLFLDIERFSLYRALSVSIFLICFLVVLAIGLGFVHSPLVAVTGDSMEPTYSEGDAIIVGSVDPTDIEEGDIVVVDVPPSLQDQYGYPPSIVHRVTEIEETDSGVEFQTEGDNTGEDPFTVYPSDIQGVVSLHIPYVGYLILYLQSFQGRLFIVAVASLAIWYYYGPTVQQRTASYLQETVSDYLGLTAVDNELVTKIRETNRKVDDVERSVEVLASATEEYGTHLQSHTHAVQQMGDAAQKLHKSVDRQNQILDQMAESVSDGSTNTVETSTLEAGDANDWPPSPDVTGVSETPPEELIDTLSSSDDPADLFGDGLTGDSDEYTPDVASKSTAEESSDIPFEFEKKPDSSADKQADELFDDLFCSSSETVSEEDLDAEYPDSGSDQEGDGDGTPNYFPSSKDDTQEEK